MTININRQMLNFFPNGSLLKPRAMAMALFILLSNPGYLFASGHEGIQIEELAKTKHSWDGSLLPPYNSGQPEITMLKITIQPGTELPWHIHPVINAALVIKGSLTIKTRAGETHQISAGDTVVELVDKVHKGYNSGSVAVELIVFYAGIVGEPITIKHE